MQKLKQNLSYIIKNPRVKGTIAAFELNTNENKNLILKQEFLKEGLLIRPLQNTIYLLPPYSIVKEELENAYYKISKVIKRI